ncbi:MAG: hypothetical protein AB6733_14290 [Clostridiaceae bacterium]
MGNLDRPFHIFFSIYPIIFIFALGLIIYFFIKDRRKNGDIDDK